MDVVLTNNNTNTTTSTAHLCTKELGNGVPSDRVCVFLLPSEEAVLSNARLTWRVEAAVLVSPQFSQARSVS
eukprot:757637-Rhodomonas_salina.2